MKGVIYARYSSDNQREESIEGQLRECKDYAERNGITILGTYIDRALSAKTDNRPEFQKMIKTWSGQIGGILCGTLMSVIFFLYFCIQIISKLFAIFIFNKEH